MQELPPGIRRDAFFDHLTLEQIYDYKYTSAENAELVRQYFRLRGYSPDCLDFAVENSVQELLHVAIARNKRECIQFAFDYGAEVMRETISYIVWTDSPDIMYYVMNEEQLDYYTNIIQTDAVKYGAQNIFEAHIHRNNYVSMYAFLHAARYNKVAFLTIVDNAGFRVPITIWDDGFLEAIKFGAYDSVFYIGQRTDWDNDAAKEILNEAIKIAEKEGQQKILAYFIVLKQQHS